MALDNGIIFLSNYKKVTGTIENNGEIKIKVERRTFETNPLLQKIQYYVYKLPIIRGLYDLAEESIGNYLVAILLEGMLYLLNFVMKNNLVLSSELNGNKFLTVVLVVACIILLLESIYLLSYLIKDSFESKATYSFHGAEHKAVNTLAASRELTLSEVKKSSRKSYSCGSNLVIFWIFILILLSVLFRSHFGIIFIAAYSLAYELFKIEKGEKIFPLSLCYKLSGIWQEKIITIEPDEKQIELAILTLKELIKA